MTRKTTLILGAGASKTYGYPTGIGLRNEILKLSEHIDAITEISSDNSSVVKNFFKYFKYSSATSIDSFVAKNPEYSEISKEVISLILLNCEDEEIFFKENLEDNWYEYFLNQILKDEFEDLNFSNIGIVTFNYDLSLEYFLHVTLSNMYKRNFNDVQKKLKDLKIHHVYGSLNKSIEKYGKTKINLSTINGGEEVDELRNYIKYISSGINLISMSRKENSEIKYIQLLIEESEKIGFLGFGFLHENIQIIRRDLPLVTVDNAKYLAATRKGMTDAEINYAMKLINGSEPRNFGENIKLINGNCTDMLRETLVLIQ